MLTDITVDPLYKGQAAGSHFLLYKETALAYNITLYCTISHFCRMNIS